MGDQVAIGASAANMVERHMEYVLRRFRVTVEDADVRLADLYRLSSGIKLKVERGAPREKQLEYVAIQLGYSVLGFDQPIRALAMYCDRERDEYSRVLEWAAWALIPDQAMVEAEQCEWTAVRLAYECGVTIRMAKVRIYWWLNPRGKKAERQAGEVVQLRPEPPAEEPPSIRYVPGKRLPGVQVPVPEDRAKALKEITERFNRQ